MAKPLKKRPGSKNEVGLQPKGKRTGKGEVEVANTLTSERGNAKKNLKGSLEKKSEMPS